MTRPRLFDSLNKSLMSDAHTFVMVSAPAGYGKTYLLAQWVARLRESGTIAAWCVVDDDERNPVDLRKAIAGALQEATRAQDGQTHPDFEGLLDVADGGSHGEFLAALAEVIDTARSRVELVVDDAHRLLGSPSEDEFIRLLRWAPDNLHISFATRTPLSTQTARVSGRLVELSADSLSFTRAETTELFSELDITPEGLERLFSAAEGWPAALSLAILNVEADVTEAGAVPDPAFLHDYLWHEVYADLSDAERSVLQVAAVTPQVTGDLVMAARQVDGSGQILRDLAMRSLMLRRVSTDCEGRTWYRIQPLFGEFVREIMRETAPDDIAAIARRAAEWHCECGHPLTALSLAVQATNPALIDTVLRSKGYELVNSGHASELIDTVQAAGDHLVLGPFARLIVAYAATTLGMVDRALDFLASPGVLDLGVDDLLEWDWLRYLVEVRLAFVRWERVDTITSGWGESTLADVSDPLRASIRLSRGLAEARSGQVEDATHDLRIALAIAENLNDTAARMMGTVGLAWVAMESVNVRATLELSEKALGLADRLTTEDASVVLAHAHTLAGWANAELLRLSAAKGHTSAASYFAQRGGDRLAIAQATLVENAVGFDGLPYRRRFAQEFTTMWPPEYLSGAHTAAVVCSLQLGLRMAIELDERRWSERLLDRARQFIGEGYDWQIAYCQYLVSVGRESVARDALGALVRDEATDRVAISDIVAWSLSAILEKRAGNDYRAHSAI
ncbi:AAA family ATPase [Glaciihabitans sp. dw_435]|uniref:AAA family ATPase n=1 Tax=Glaciihabitans sp. dw_435 TaxID=2720081 RepID=UPI001BD24B77|nr:AAA family ATPase [Glaciihabitans sp. dw_435]